MRMYGDPENKIAAEAREAMYLPDLVVAMPEDVSFHPMMGRRSKYPTGCVQPGVLVLKAPSVPLYRWSVEVKLSNAYGAAARVDLLDVWKGVHPRIQPSYDGDNRAVTVEARTMSCWELFCCMCCLSCCRPSRKEDGKEAISS
eukprot:TRINITY_DN33481_c0_g1_i1.p3 TRINITY_DN33481_c0_g1~~TRINITY_DN33481_c0_g1_i1.p3  ORF type:complete len:143 (+),score=23.90 TRINITY_DN33481_c0_g1_i1:275-703(+)